jgi:predicted transcriptional regulator of viral defense system
MMTNQINTHSLKKIEQLLASPQTIFTVQDLGVLWQVTDKTALYSNIQYYLRVGKLKRVHKGIYALSVKEYNSFELAQKLIRPSYISFYTALEVHGITFQVYSAIHSVALKSKQLTVNQEKFIYHQLKEKVFYDSLGIEDKTTYLIAGPERAICDSLYLSPGLSFDSLDDINLVFLSQVSKIYNNQRLEEEVATIIKLEKN